MTSEKITLSQLEGFLFKSPVVWKRMVVRSPSASNAFRNSGSLYAPVSTSSHAKSLYAPGAIALQRNGRIDWIEPLCSAIPCMGVTFPFMSAH